MNAGCHNELAPGHALDDKEMRTMSIDNDAVSSVGVISTGSGALHPEHMYGTRKPALWWVARSKEWITVPLNVFVIEHEQGLVLFDTGMDPAASTDPDYWSSPVVRWFLDHIFQFKIGPEDGLANRLLAAGYQVDDVKAAVLSHLHFDHVGGIAEIPNAELLVAPDAWDHLVQSPHPDRDYVPRDKILVPGATWRLLEFAPINDPDLAPFTEACDVMGDGSLMVVPTPGHIAGAVSMLIRSASAAPILLIGDLSYSEELLLRHQVAGTGDKATLLDSFAKIRAMKTHTPELVIIASHDTTASDKLIVAHNPAPEATPVD